MTFLILGAGVGGLTLAVKLAQLGQSFLITEQHNTAADVGAGLLLAPNAASILQELGVWDDLLLRGRATKRWTILDQSGGILREIEMPVTGPLALSIHRADLLTVLRSRLPAGVLRTGVQVTALATTKDTVTLSMAD